MFKVGLIEQTATHPIVTECAGECQLSHPARHLDGLSQSAHPAPAQRRSALNSPLLPFPSD
jgi:hypothetical protein